MACLTVVDPIVAVLFGVALLGEGNATSPAHWAVLIAAALAATGGSGCWPATTPRPPPAPATGSPAPRAGDLHAPERNYLKCPPRCAS